MEPNNKKRIVLATEVKPVTAAEILEIGRPDIGCYIGKNKQKDP